jgi:outer membrane protein TolC
MKLPFHARRFGLGASLAVVLSVVGQSANAQESKSAPLSLSECVALGMQHQPALTAAQASLSSAENGYRGIHNLRFARLLSGELRVRRQQACLGIDIAAAGLMQAEWETRYAVTRNFYSVLYARQQEDLLKKLVTKLEDARKKAEKIVEAGSIKSKVTTIDVKVLAINVALVKTKVSEASIGTEKALGALREAIGVDRSFSLEVAGELPALVKVLNRDQLIDMALARRGEITQAETALDVTGLEVQAQRRVFGPTARTFAAGSDVHARPIPQGVSNTDYRPGAIGLEIPTTLVGRRTDRVSHAQDFQVRAGAVVDKTRNLITLEVDVSYLKWKEAVEKAGALSEALKLAKDVAATMQKRFYEDAVSGEDFLRARGLEDQTQAQLNEAIYNHALGLAAIERVTAGGYTLDRPAAKLPDSK